MATFSNFAKHTFSTMATADSDKSANAEYIKAKFRLTSAADYDRLLRLISPPSPPQSPSNNTASSAKSSFELTRIYTEQDYIFDGKAHDLWHAGLTLAIRHSVERYPLQGPQSVCTVALKETSFKDLIGLDGHLLAMDQLDGAPFYEVKERSEVVDYGPLQGLVNLGETLTAENCGQSQILCSTISKYYVQDGISCVGSFITVRHEFEWLSARGKPRMQVDKCSFPHGEGYYVQFPPDEITVKEITAYLKTNGISYSMNTISKTELFFQGLQMINCMALQKTTDPSALSPQMFSESSEESSTVDSPGPDGRRHSLQDQQHSDSMSQSSSSLQSISNFTTSFPTMHSGINNSNNNNRRSHAIDVTAVETQRRGRKSLQMMLTEAAANPARMLANIPKQLMKAFEEMGVDLTKVRAEEVPELVNQYNRHRNSIASAKYRKRKLEQSTIMAAEIDRLKTELETYRRRCQNLEAELAVLKAAKRQNNNKS